MPRLAAGAPHDVTILLNGAKRNGRATPRMLLSDFLRQELGALGTHVGCEHGVCGACTVRVDGVAVRGCLMLAVQADGRRVDTIEGLAADGRLSTLQEAFSRHHALQCGFCTAGILMSLTDYLGHHPQADEAALRDVLGGHLCRCTGYVGMLRALREVTEGGSGKAERENSRV